MREIRKTIAAGGEEFVDAAGDFIFCSFADRKVHITIDGQPVTVKAGDKVRPQKRIKDFLIRNPDPVNEVVITLVVGEGDYNSQLIQGEVSVLPGVRGADGAWKDDTRHTITLDMYPARTFEKTFPKGEPIWLAADLRYDAVVQEGAIREYHITVTQGPFGVAHLINRQRRTGASWPGNGIIRHYSTSGVLLSEESVSHLWPGVCSAAYWKGVLYIQSGVGIRLGATDQTIYTNASSLAFVSGWNDGLVFVQASDRSWYKFNPETLSVTSIARPAADLSYAATQNRLVWLESAQVGVMASSSKFHFMNSSFEEIAAASTYAQADIGNPSADGFAMLSTRFHVTPGNGFNQAPEDGTLGVYPFEELVEPASFTAMKAGCVDGLIMKGNRGFITGADITATQGAGQLIVTGEVIKASLEQYFGRDIGNGYMDHVYRFATDSSQYGGLATVIEGGSRSLQARGEADNLSLILPARISITIDDDLPLI